MARTVLLGGVVVVFGAIATFAAPDPQPDIVGVYRCSGVNPDGTPYEGVAEIAKIDGTYRILCLEFCGVSHHGMIGQLEVTS